MSVYERRYEVCSNRNAYYTDDPAEALRLMERDPDAWCNAGYGDVGYQDEHVTEVIRRTIGPVTRGQLMLAIYRRERVKVEQMIQDLRSGTMVVTS